MGIYKIIQTYPCNENGYVYVDALINDEEVPRRLILPDDPSAAQDKMLAYLDAENDTPVVVQDQTTSLDVLIDETVEV
jgi:glycine cleavage system aminomethyltransferase T